MAGLINLKDEKSRVAFYSVIAAILLTTFKIVVGVLLIIFRSALYPGCRSFRFVNIQAISIANIRIITIPATFNIFFMIFYGLPPGR